MHLSDSCFSSFCQELLSRFSRLRLNSRSFMVCSSSRLLNFQCALKLIDYIPPVDRYIIRQEKVTTISIDDIREMKESVSYRAISSQGKAVIIENADVLSIEAQNALLKILEEPPGSLIFILCVRNPENLIPTVLSRLIRLNIPLPSVKDKNKVISSGDFFLTDPAEMFFLDSFSEIPTFSEEVFFTFLNNSQKLEISPDHISVYSYFTKTTSEILDQAFCGNFSQAFRLFYSFHSSIDNMLDKYEKENSREDAERFRKDCLYQHLLLKTVSEIKKIIISEPGRAEQLLVSLNISEKWFLSKNLKFCCFFENLLLSLYV